MSGPASATLRQRLSDRLVGLSNCPLVTLDFKSAMIDNEHTNNVLDYAPDFCAPIASTVAIDHAMLLVFCNRSGSNYLAQLIRSTGKYNLASEAFNGDVVTNRSRKLGLDRFGAYLDDVKTRAVKGRLACKVSLSQFVFLHASSFLDSHLANRTVVLVQRDDKIAQAISHWIAHHTKQWTSEQSKKWEGEVPFDGDRITQIVQRAFAEEQDTRIVMSLLGQAYLTANYEDFQASPNYVVRRILEACGVEGATIKRRLVTLERQSGALNEELRSKYLDHISGSTGTPGRTDGKVEDGEAAGARTSLLGQIARPWRWTSA